MSSIPGKVSLVEHDYRTPLNPWSRNSYEKGMLSRTWGAEGLYSVSPSLMGEGPDIRRFFDLKTELNPLSHLDPLRHLRILFPGLPEIIPTSWGGLAAGLKPGMLAPFAPWIVAAAEREGYRRPKGKHASEPHAWGGALHHLSRKGERGRKALDAAVRAGHRAHQEGRHRLPPELVRHLERHAPRRFNHPEPPPPRRPPPPPPPPPRRGPPVRYIDGQPGDEFKDHLGELGIVPIVAAVVALAPVAIKAITPWLKAAAQKAGHKVRDGHEAVRKLKADPRGQRYIEAAVRAALRAHGEGRASLPPEIVGPALAPALLPFEAAGALPQVTMLSGPPKAPPKPRGPLPSRLPSIRELAALGRNMTAQQVMARVNDAIRLRVRLMTLTALARAGKLSPQGKAHLARATALYKFAVRLLEPVKPYLERVYPSAAQMFVTSDLAGADLGIIQVATPVIIGGVAAVAVAVAGAALVGVASVLAASWAQAKAAEAQAVQAEGTRREAIEATQQIVSKGIEADPGQAETYVDAGIDALVDQADAAEQARSQASESTADATGGGMIFGLPWWIVALGAFLAMREFGGR